ncbi:MAG: hypothetical protein OEY07_19105, partial [Gammaproteobacteria bacterium]|nr:hypothetical protein [Gammaproteobacteria bacterium]
AKPGDSYYPFQFIVSTMTIVKVLRGEAIAGENVEVYPADFDSQVELHRKYYLEGISKSPIYQKYEPVSRPQEGEQYIVFLRRTKDGHWSFFCLGAGEGLDQLSTITELLKSR